MKHPIQRKWFSRFLSAFLILALSFPTPSAFALRPSIQGAVEAGLEESLRPPTAGLEEAEEGDLSRALNRLYQFPAFFGRYVDSDGIHPGGWPAFLKDLEQGKGWFKNGAFEDLKSLPEPELYVVPGNLVFHNDEDGVLIAGDVGAGKALLSAFLAGSRESGWTKPDTLGGLIVQREHSWTFLAQNDILVLRFPSSGRFYAGRLPRTAQKGGRGRLTTAFPLVGGKPVKGNLFRLYQTSLREKNQFVPLKGVVHLDRYSLSTRGLSELGIRLPGSKRLFRRDLIVSIPQVSNGHEPDDNYEKAVKTLQTAVSQMNSWMEAVRRQAGLEERGEVLRQIQTQTQTLVEALQEMEQGLAQSFTEPSAGSNLSPALREAIDKIRPELDGVTDRILLLLSKKDFPKVDLKALEAILTEQEKISLKRLSVDLDLIQLDLHRADYLKHLYRAIKRRIKAEEESPQRIEMNLWNKWLNALPKEEEGETRAKYLALFRMPDQKRESTPGYRDPTRVFQPPRSIEELSKSFSDKGAWQAGYLGRFREVMADLLERRRERLVEDIRGHRRKVQTLQKWVQSLLEQAGPASTGLEETVTGQDVLAAALYLRGKKVWSVAVYEREQDGTETFIFGLQRSDFITAWDAFFAQANNRWPTSFYDLTVSGEPDKRLTGETQVPEGQLHAKAVFYSKPVETPAGETLPDSKPSEEDHRPPKTLEEIKRKLRDDLNLDSGLEERIVIHLGSHVLSGDFQPTVERLRRKGTAGKQFFVGEDSPWPLDLLEDLRPDIARYLPRTLWADNFDQSVVGIDLRKLVEDQAGSTRRDLEKLRANPGFLRDPAMRERLQEHFKAYFPIIEYLAEHPEITAYFEQAPWSSWVTVLREFYVYRDAIWALFHQRDREAYFKSFADFYRLIWLEDDQREEEIERQILRPVLAALRDDPAAELQVLFGGAHFHLAERVLKILREYGMDLSDVAVTQEELSPEQKFLEPYRLAMLADPSSTLPDNPEVRRAALEFLPRYSLQNVQSEAKRVKTNWQAMEATNAVMTAMSPEELDLLIAELQDRYTDFYRAARKNFRVWQELAKRYIIAWLNEHGKLGPVLENLDEEAKQLTTAQIDRSVGRNPAAGLEETARAEEKSIVVPVANNLMVGILAHSPGIRELQASLGDSGIQIKKVESPQESGKLLRGELVGLLILAPEDSEAGDWRGGTLVPTVVMPAFVAAGLTERELAALAAEATARGGILHINDITREGAEEQILVLRMA